MPWATQGRLTNPTANTVLADTGPLPQGPTLAPQIVASSTVLVQLLFQRRNAANDATITEQSIVVLANSSTDIPIKHHMELQDGERLRVATFANVTGTVQASILW